MHPSDATFDEVVDQIFEITVHTRQPAPLSLALAFSDWLAALRAALNNALHALASAISG